MTNEQVKRILVSGASVAGLTTPYWLHKYGFAVTVVERASGLRPGGQALDVRGPALEIAALAPPVNLSAPVPASGCVRGPHAACEYPVR
jgi:glycine/D-amino acid oxidase-like deaminating enzyme